MPKTTPCLWFDSAGEEAANFYVGIFPNSRIVDVTHYNAANPEAEGAVMTVSFELDGQPYVALNGGPLFTFDEAVSFQIDCADQDEVDYYWNALSAGGQEGPCGWLKDRYGLSWQVVPGELPELVGDADPQRAAAVMRVMYGMGKLDVAELRRAADEATQRA